MRRFFVHGSCVLVVLASTGCSMLTAILSNPPNADVKARIEGDPSPVAHAGDGIKPGEQLDMR
jgi:hypothetical protein